TDQAPGLGRERRDQHDEIALSEGAVEGRGAIDAADTGGAAPRAGHADDTPAEPPPGGRQPPASLPGAGESDGPPPALHGPTAPSPASAAAAGGAVRIATPPRGARARAAKTSASGGR